jgi:hypothetical protein
MAAASSVSVGGGWVGVGSAPVQAVSANAAASSTPGQVQGVRFVFMAVSF